MSQPDDPLTTVRDRIQALPPRGYVVIMKNLMAACTAPEGWDKPAWILEGIPRAAIEVIYSVDGAGNVTFEKRRTPLTHGWRSYVSPEDGPLFMREGLFWRPR